VDKYSNGELTQFLFEALSGMDTQFQYWISLTFGALVAAFLAGDRLGLPVRLLAIVLYLLATAVLFIRFLSAGFTATAIQAYLDSTQASVVGSYLLGFLPMMRPPLFVLGAGATIFFLLRPLSMRGRHGSVE